MVTLWFPLARAILVDVRRSICNGLRAEGEDKGSFGFSLNPTSIKLHLESVSTSLVAGDV
jgi:hypothetical protein